MSAETIVRRAMANAGLPHAVHDAQLGACMVLFNEHIARGQSTATAEMVVTRAVQLVVSQEKKEKKPKVERGRGDDDEHAVQEEIEVEVFAQYACRSLTDTDVRANRHPGDIAEAGLLASVGLPALRYDVGALRGAAERGELSDLQLEGALAACQRHCAVVEGTRAGFFLGDGAGVGKGRQIAAVVLDGVARGEGKHVWFSIASDLKIDAERDLGAVGCHVPVIDGCQSLDAAASKAFGGSHGKRGVLFSTYSTLISAASGRGSRLDQLVAWCGGHAFSGCLVFDEAHKAKNFNAKQTDASTKVSQAVLAIQERLPLARVVYASATGVTEISNMAYATRLGLWGSGTPFESFRVFAETMDKRGVGALEMLALELKSSGAYVSRGLAWTRCEFDNVECALDESAARDYDAQARWWRGLRRALDHAARKTGVKKGTLWQRFWGAQLRFFKEVQTAAKVPFVVREARRALDEGRSVVIGLQSTGEAGLGDVMAEKHKRFGDAAPGLCSSARASAKKFVLEFFPTTEALKELDDVADEPVPDDAVIYRLLATARGPPSRAEVDSWKRARAAAKAEAIRRRAHPLVFQDLVELKRQILRVLEELPTPPSPLDALVDALGGPAGVAEMTGRSGRVVRGPSGKFKYEARGGDSGDHSLNVAERKAFMDGRKHVAIISDAASTGVSLHAARGSPAAGRRRVHITLELAWSADKSIQQLGRSHRANQESAPVYKLLTTNLGGEARFASAVAKRLASLGALTKGDRRAASGQDLSDFDLDTRHGRAALAKLAEACTSRFDAAAVALGVDPGAKGHEALKAALDGARRDYRARARGDGEARFAAAGSFAPFSCDAYAAADRSADLPAGDDSGLLAALARAAYEELAIDPKKDGDVRTFLNKLQAATVADQGLLFEYFTACHRCVLRDALANGTLDAGVADIRATRSWVVRGEELGRDAVSGAATLLSEIRLDRGVDFDLAVRKHDAAASGAARFEGRGGAPGDLSDVSDLEVEGDDARRRASANGAGTTCEAYRGTGFYVSRKKLPSTNAHGVLLAVKKANSTAFYVITRPNTGTSPFEMAANELREKYRAHAGTLLDAPEAARAELRAEWTAQYDVSANPGRGCRFVDLGLVSGAVLPFWRALEKTVTDRRDDMTRAEQNLKVVRVVLDDGSKIVGIRFPKPVLADLKAHLTAAHAARRDHARDKVKAAPPRPVDAKLLKAANAPPKTIKSFFKPRDDNAPAPPAKRASTQRPATGAAAPAKPAAKRKPESAAFASFFKKPKDGKAAASDAKPASSKFFAKVETARAKVEPARAAADSDEDWDPDADGDAPRGSSSSSSRRASPRGSSSSAPAAPKPKVEYSECPCCTAFIETSKINAHLDNDCPGFS